MLTRMGRDIVRNNAALGHDEAVAPVVATAGDDHDPARGRVSEGPQDLACDAAARTFHEFEPGSPEFDRPPVEFAHLYRGHDLATADQTG